MEPVILDSRGEIIPPRKAALCPGCGAGPETRVPSSGFGVAHLICKNCGHEFTELICPSVTE